MIAKLIKKEGHYHLFGEIDLIGIPRFISTTDCKEGTPNKLSKQNCDEMFGIVDVEKLADVCGTESCDDNDRHFFKEGFNKCLELNKDKLFTVGDMKNAYIQGTNDGAQFESMRDHDCEDNELWKFAEEVHKEFMDSLKQPTEIEVEIVMGTLCRQIDCVDDTRLIESKIVWGKEDPMLDENGCLILKKKS
jgi:hypothetical protein